MLPEDLRYTSTHEWCRLEGNEATVGITEFALKEIPEVMFIELPDVGDDILADTAFAEIESVAKVRDVLSPMDGQVTEVNLHIAESPADLAKDPYDEGWLIKMRVTKPSQFDKLMKAKEYVKHAKSSRA